MVAPAIDAPLAQGCESAHQGCESAHQGCESARVEAVAEMCAGVAHELNNPLSVILGYTRLLRSGKTPTHEVPAQLEKIEIEARRCQDILGRLMSLARAAPAVATETVDLTQAVRDAIEDLARPDAISLTAVAGPLVRADPNMLHEALVQLLLNAVEANPGGQADAQVGEERGLAVVSVRDHGPGLGSLDGARLKQPFFSTKPDRMGLGLTLCDAVVVASGGRLEVQAAANGGVCATLALPISQ